MLTVGGDRLLFDLTGPLGFIFVGLTIAATATAILHIVARNRWILKLQDQENKIKELDNSLSNASYEIRQEFLKENKDIVIDTNKNEENSFIFFEVEDKYKSIFVDMMNGFIDFAKIKGYDVSVSLNSSLFGKVGMRFEFKKDDSSTYKAQVRGDIDEYISKIRNSDDFDGMPIVTSPIEHERLVSALKMRFVFLKHTAEMHAVTANAYKAIVESISMNSNSFHSRALEGNVPNLNISVITAGGKSMRDNFKISASEGVAIGDGNKISTNKGIFISGRTSKERLDQIELLSNLENIVTNSIENKQKKDSSIKKIRKSKEELQNHTPDDKKINRWLSEIKETLQIASTGADVVTKSKSIFQALGLL